MVGPAPRTRTSFHHSASDRPGEPAQPNFSPTTGVTRTTNWPDPLQCGGQLRWRDLCHKLAPLARGINLWDELRDFAARLLPLPALLEDEGFPTEALHFPRIWVNTLKKTLQDWGLR
jgi:serine/threonine-protein kinase HipA